MINIDQVGKLTQAYIVSYNTALQDTNNPNLATQVAMSIVMAILTVEETLQPKMDPLQVFKGILDFQKKNLKNDEDFLKKNLKKNPKNDDAEGEDKNG